MRWVFVLVALAGCTETKAEVSCQGGATGILCNIKHVQGSDTVNVCFDMVLSCRSGSTAKAHACQVVAPSQIATKNLVDADFKGLDTCEVNGSTVTGLTLAKR